MMSLAPSTQPTTRSGLPLRGGAGFKPGHVAAWLADAETPAFAEVHAENYMGAGGAPHAWLTQLCERTALSVHGVGLSIGADAPLDAAHLQRLALLLARYRPAAFSEHLAWSTHAGAYLADLLPVIYDHATLDRVCAHVDQVQSRLRVRMLLENPSSYFDHRASTLEESDFLARVVQRTGCGLLLDVNNVYVSCHNQRRDPFTYLGALPLHAVGEIHLAGHALDIGNDGDILLIDDHGASVSAAVWALYARVLAKIGPRPTLIEWDNAVPDYAVLREEVRRADRLLDAAPRAPLRVAA